MQRYVHVVSHGPQCLDGVTAAVVVSCFHPDTCLPPLFCSNTSVNRTLREFEPKPASAEHELWITDISWTDPAADEHLTNLQKQGVQIVWIDHHRTAIERFRAGQVQARVLHTVLDETYAASRLTFDFLRRRYPDATLPPFLERLVELADDNDRWLHRFPESHALALAVGALDGSQTFSELMAFAQSGAWGERLQAAHTRAQREVGESLTLANLTRRERKVPERGVTVVAALCDGYPSEVAESWKGTSKESVFAFFDLRSRTVSFRRTPDCSVDLSQLARRLGGGGHPAAAGCDLPELFQALAAELLDTVEGALRSSGAKDPEGQGGGGT